MGFFFTPATPLKVARKARVLVTRDLCVTLLGPHTQAIGIFYYHHFLNPYPLTLPNFCYLCLMAASGPNPKKRNSKAGKSTGTSKSAKYFAKNKAARDKKNAYNKEYHASPARKKYRAKLNKANRASPNGSKDKSHTKSGKLTNEKRSSNRARNGRGGKSSKK